MTEMTVLTHATAISSTRYFTVCSLNKVFTLLTIHFSLYIVNFYFISLLQQCYKPSNSKDARPIDYR